MKQRWWGLATVLIAAVASAAASASPGRSKEPWIPQNPAEVILTLPARSASERVVPRNVAEALQQAETWTATGKLGPNSRYLGRAEALLEQWAKRPDASAALLTLQARLQQQRHAFAEAESVLERALRLEPRMADARLLRASTRLTRGDFAAARADCAVLIGQGETFAGSACLAQSLAAMGSIAAAGALLGRALEPCARPSAMAAAATTVGVAADAALCAWALGIRADLAQRRGDSAAAERDLRAALQRDARSELLRIQLAQLLMARGAADQAATWLDVPYPSVAMQVQRLALLDPNQAGHAALRAQVEAQLALGRARGERLHLREETQLALDIDHDMPRALALARANFAVQRELVDVRMLARAATGARDAAALRELADWTRGWGYADVVVQRMLASGGA